MYQAVNEYVILKPLKAVDVSAGGIVLPDKSKDQFGDNAEIVSVGEEVDPVFQVGDIVLRPDPARVEITDPKTGEVFLIVSDEDLMAKWDQYRRVFKVAPDGETTVSDA